MSQLVERFDDERTDREPVADADRPRIDVSDLQAKGVEEFVRTNVGTDRVSLEHRGSHTYLLLEE
ncbi:hypothetical protein [Halostagnicola kamekurae]|uniref:Uncharacterized protein n=1 Tax=Halostagnicola kamekurae TaxID=619731 RepID=A0A1I6Q4Z5_9EURY|nr:hypothetical protein [Halostagnicola kamekurae]SFS47464.1 hypothetical protein SAMN04488556_0981 [Halostagnicola kamekurae]